jgi:hypothetical protein
MRSDLVDLQTRNEELSEELHSVLVQVHKNQLQQMPKPEGAEISSSLSSALLQRSPTHCAGNAGNFENNIIRILQDYLFQSFIRYNLIVLALGVNVDKLVRYLQNWKKRLEFENESLRTSIATLQAEVCGARLSAKYLDKELAGRFEKNIKIIIISYHWVVRD